MHKQMRAQMGTGDVWECLGYRVQNWGLGNSTPIVQEIKIQPETLNPIYVYGSFLGGGV